MTIIKIYANVFSESQNMSGNFARKRMVFMLMV